MLWRVDYVTDSGKVYYQISLFTETESNLLPEIYTNSAIKGRGFCDLPKSIKPRHALITKEDGSISRIEYPFAPGTAEWFLFWQQIQNNPLIIDSKGIGETVKLRRR